MSHVTMNSGTEGPNFDPYHYDEIHVERPNGDAIELHSGLASWCIIKRKGKIAFEVSGDKESWSLFENYVGCDPLKVEKAYRSIPFRRFKYHACRPRQFEVVSGYPGETFTICKHCNGVINSSFDRSEIE